MFWELYQEGRINSATRKAGRAQLEAEQTKENLALLESKIETLALACQSLWELLRENTNLNETDLESKIEEIDLRDGRRDGKMTKITEACPQCERRTSCRRPRCLYCGTALENGELFGRR
ncbi:MAG: hypothetical protein ACI87E_002512 [Mariniblastus sp.]|jgi:hypothetical protein